MRHRPRGVHRRALPGLRVRARPRDDRHPRTRSGRPRPSVGACAPATASRSRSSCRAARASRAAPACTGVASGTASRDMYGFVPVDRPPGLWGGYAEYQYLAPDSLLVPGRPGPRFGDGDVVQPARGGDPVGGHRPRDAAGRHRGGARPRRARALGLRGGEVGRRGVRHGHRQRCARREPTRRGRAVRRRPRGRRGARGSRRRASARDWCARRRRRRRHREGAGRARSGRAARARRAGRSCWRGRAARPTHPASTPTSSSTRSYACSARSASTRRRIAPRWICSRRVAFPFEELSRQVAGFDDTPALLRAMAGEGEHAAGARRVHPSLRLRLHDEHGALCRAHEPAFVLDIDAHDRGAPRSTKRCARSRRARPS